MVCVYCSCTTACNPTELTGNRSPRLKGLCITPVVFVVTSMQTTRDHNHIVHIQPADTSSGGRGGSKRRPQDVMPSTTGALLHTRPCIYVGLVVEGQAKMAARTLVLSTQVCTAVARTCSTPAAATTASQCKQETMVRNTPPYTAPNLWSTMLVQHTLHKPPPRRLVPAPPPPRGHPW